MGLINVVRLPTVVGYAAMTTTLDINAGTYTEFNSGGFVDPDNVPLAGGLRYCTLEVQNDGDIAIEAIFVDDLVTPIPAGLTGTAILPGRLQSFDLYPLGGQNGIVRVGFRLNVRRSDLYADAHTIKGRASLRAGFLRGI